MKNSSSLGTVISAAAILAFAVQSFAQLSVTPCSRISQDKDAWWATRFEATRNAAETGTYDIVFLGDSITHYWERAGADVWNANFTNAPYRALNCGFSADRTEHLLWRLRNGQFGRLSPKAVVVMIGTNNTGHRPVEKESPLDTIVGIQAVLDEIAKKCPSAKIILHPIFPRGAATNDPARVRNDVVNDAIKKFTDGKNILWCDFNSRLLTSDGVLELAVAPDLLHPGKSGYEIWAKSLKPYLDYALGLRTKPPAPAAKPAPTALPKGRANPLSPKLKFRWLSKAGNYRLATKRAEELDSPDKTYDAIWLGDSITHFWEHKGKDEVFNRKFKSYRIFNLGFGGDKVENLLWDVMYGGFLDGVEAKTISLMIGTNNTWSDSAEDIAEGISILLAKIREKQPSAKILLYALLPREVAHKRGDRDFRRNDKNVDEIMPKHIRINELIKPLADGKDVLWVDMTARFTDEEGLPDIRLLGDGTHPNAAGCEAWADEVLPIYRQLLGR